VYYIRPTVATGGDSDDDDGDKVAEAECSGRYGNEFLYLAGDWSDQRNAAAITQ